MITIGVKRNGEPAWLEAAAAASFARMVADGCPADGITDAGRTFAEQLELWEAYLRGDLPATASRPGSPEALHQQGIALDLRGATLTWVRLHGRAYGWLIDTIPREPWHVVYAAAADTRRTPTPPTREALMRVVKCRQDGRYYLAGPAGLVYIGNPDELAQLIAVFGPALERDAGNITHLRNALRTYTYATRS